MTGMLLSGFVLMQENSGGEFHPLHWLVVFGIMFGIPYLTYRFGLRVGSERGYARGYKEGQQSVSTG